MLLIENTCEWQSQQAMPAQAVTKKPCSQGNWIVDSGSTCHMCNDQELFGELLKRRDSNIA